MRLSLFRRRRIAPADLPPVSAAAVPGPLHSGLTGDMAMLAGAAGLSAVAAETPIKAEPAATVWAQSAPQPVPGPILGAAPLYGAPTPLWRPGTYTVTYDRLIGLTAPAPLVTDALTSGELAYAVARDIRSLTGLDVSVIVDLIVEGGTIRGASGRVGNFTYEQRGGSPR